METLKSLITDPTIITALSLIASVFIAKYDKTNTISKILKKVVDKTESKK